MKCCCDDLAVSVERGEITYNPIRGCFWFYFKRDGTSEFGQYRLGFCPFCGTKLPKDMIFDFEDALEKATGKEYCDIKPEDIPEEFKSDEWWKKRGL